MASLNIIRPRGWDWTWAFCPWQCSVKPCLDRWRHNTAESSWRPLSSQLRSPHWWGWSGCWTPPAWFGRHCPLKRSCKDAELWDICWTNVTARSVQNGAGRLTGVAAAQRSWPLYRAPCFSCCKCAALCKDWRTPATCRRMSAAVRTNDQSLLIFVKGGVEQDPDSHRWGLCWSASWGCQGRPPLWFHPKVRNPGSRPGPWQSGRPPCPADPVQQDQLQVCQKCTLENQSTFLHLNEDGLILKSEHAMTAMF